MKSHTSFIQRPVTFRPPRLVWMVPRSRVPSANFDAETGLLVRQVRYTEAFLGRNMQQLDYDDYRGVITYVRVVDGELRKGQKIRFMGNDKEYQVTDLGKLMPRPARVERIGTTGKRARRVARHAAPDEVRMIRRGRLFTPLCPAGAARRASATNCAG